MEYILIIVAGIFVNNIVLAQFLGICPFLGVSKKVETSVGMAGAVLFVMTLATIATWLIQQMVEIILKKVSPALYQALGIFLPLITTNCAVLGVAVLVMQKDYDLAQGVVYTVANALGFGLALIIFAGLREQLSLANVPKGMKGMPIALVTAAILALAFMGFSGMV